MSNQDARKIFDAVIAKTTDKDAIARIEICREYFTNVNFRKAMQDFVWEQNN